LEQPEYHKGERCPYAEKMGKGPILCQEGFCCPCQVWHDLKGIERIGEAGVETKQCSKLDDCPKIKLILDKDLLDFQYAKAIRAVCAKCDEMETEATTAQASEKMGKKKWVKVQIYTPTHIWAGSAYCPHERLLDFLNGVLMPANEEFITLSNVKVRSPDGSEATLPSAYINKANILFVREIEANETRGLGGQAGHKLYPFVPKGSTSVKISMPFYNLSGQVHYAKGEHVYNVLNSGIRFLAMTDVEICPSAGSSESAVSFIAINKRHVLSLEEMGIPLMGMSTQS